MSIAVVTAWRDHLELREDFFAAIECAKPDQVVVVDDGSQQPLEFAAVRLDEPAGFCSASNAGFALVETDMVLMLNNDIGPTRGDWLDPYRRLIEPGYIVGPLRFDSHGGVDGVAYPYVDGWALGMMTEDARRLGGWDESYDVAGPAYFSDNALSFRARMAGMTLREVRPGLAHKGGQTGGVDRAVFDRALATNAELFAEQVRAAIAK